VISPRPSGVAPHTVRYYERAGLLPPPRRTPAGYRSYDADAVDRLTFIQGAERLGLRLRDIADLLAVRDSGAGPCELAELDVEMTLLASLCAQLVAMADALPSAVCPPRHPGPSGVHPHGKEVTTMLDLIRLSCCCDDPGCPPDCGCDC